jgi:hypothetical protein
MVQPNPPERDIRGRDILLTLPFVLVSLALLIDVFPRMPMPMWIIKHVQENRWYRAASWAAWLFCGLGGALLIGMAVTMGMTSPPLGQASEVLGGLQLTGMVVCLVDLFVIGGLLVIGYIVQGTKETREFASAWGRTKGQVVAGSAPEDSHPA